MGAGSLIHVRRLALFFGLLAPGGAVHAQRIRGEVLLADSATRAAGMIVVVSGAAGETIARALTGERGGFDIALPREGRYAVRVLRIGYQPTMVPPFDVAADESRSLRIVLSGAPIVLARVTVRGETSCRLGKDSGQLVARVWDEARKAITASQLGAADIPLVAEWIDFERTLSPDGRAVRRQVIRSTRGVTTHAFVSLPGDSLAEIGYVVAETDGTRYFAPDADVLLSESFAALHCFRVEPAPAAQPNLIGVGFRPAREREGMRDIEGTFWLDRESAELRWLDYHYTGLHAVATDAGAGGRVEFLRLASGNWLINRWHIRMPMLLATPGRVRNPFGTSMNMGQPRLRAIEVDGGEVTLVLRKDSVVYRATGATLLARIISPDTLVGTRGGVMTVDGTDYTAPVDSTGRVRLTPVLAGPYHVRVRTSSMESMGAPPAEFDLDVTEGEPREATLTLPAAVELVRGVCGEQSGRAAEALLHGTVRDAAGKPISDTKVTVSWQSRFLDVPGGGYATVTQTREVVADGLGRWRLCGVPRLLPITARLTDNADDPKRATALVRIGLDQPFAEVSLVGAVSAVAEAARTDAPPNGLMDVTVANRAGHPLADATIDVTAKGTSFGSVHTDSLGRVQLAQVPSGRVELRVRRIGYRAGDVAVEIEPGRNTVPVILDKSYAPSLDTVRILGDRRVSARLDDFETRRARGEATVSISKEEIAKRNPLLISQLLQNVPSIRLTPDDLTGKILPISNRGMKMALIHDANGLVKCVMAIMVDGVQMPESTEVNLMSPRDLHGIEVFAGAASIPVKYGSMLHGQWCGLIAYWTRDR